VKGRATATDGYQCPSQAQQDSFIPLPSWHPCFIYSPARYRSLTKQASGISGGKIASDSQGGGIGRSVGGFIDPKLNWNDISWLRKHTKLPIGLKGIQSVEDAKRAMEAGVDAIYLSNHGLVLPLLPSFLLLSFLR
jgi:isopentenyl diphosphate isomerase/L-lactate dehydrogenase-like FMN-dependent dehydrogenase